MRPAPSDNFRVAGIAFLRRCGRAYGDPVDFAAECYHGDHGVVLHPDCFVAWEEARQ
jgi:hypothetical protein